jgi:hypothetical protein
MRLTIPLQLPFPIGLLFATTKQVYRNYDLPVIVQSKILCFSMQNYKWGHMQGENVQVYYEVVLHLMYQSGIRVNVNTKDVSN